MVFLQGGQTFDHYGHLVPNPGRTLMSVQTPEKSEEETDTQVVHLSETAVIFEGGFIDFHLHLRGQCDTIGIEELGLLKSGVVAVGDAGTYGWNNWAQRGRTQVVQSRGWVSLLKDGLTHHPEVPTFTGFTVLEEEKLAELFADRQQAENHPVGLKIRLGQHSEQEDRLLLITGVAQARRLQVPLMVHLTGSFLSAEEVVERLAAGDVLTHAYQGRRGNILSQGGISPTVAAAVKNGLILDVGHGKNHFSWRVFQAALQAGLVPTTVSTDHTQNTWESAPVFNLSYVMSKLWAAGLTWEDLYWGVVRNPSRLLQLHPREDAAVVLDFHKETQKFTDAQGETLIAPGVWFPVLVVVNGRVIVQKMEK
ncbi:hypothetical protein D2Q93_08180 [Alicyclobacillaceae bacterium I2511]|nr:hypothetical protein D2Q93_08180 [Alicyclobacillaceae bacterium I2511]